MEANKPMVMPVSLKGGNYLLWTRAIRTALCSRGLWEHVETTHVPMTATKEEEQAIVLAEERKWFQEDQTVLAILQNSLNAPIYEAYSYCESAKTLWDQLKKVYGNTTNVARIFEIKRAIIECKQSGAEFTQHFGRFRALRAELETLRPRSLDPDVLDERDEQDRVFELLFTLDPEFNDLTKHLIRVEKLPSLDDVCAYVQKEQATLGMIGGKGELVTANKVMFRRDDKKKPLWCEHCKRSTHSKDKCWVLHPHLRPPRPYNTSRANFYQEGGTGSNRPSSSRQFDRAHQEAAMIVSHEEVVKKSDLEDLIKATMATTIASLKESGITLFSHKTNKSFVIDSGASHHMISNANLLDKIEPTLGSVTIANGDRIPVKGVGNLRLFDKDSKAFFMPDFRSNLLSVQKVTSDLNCYTIFGPNHVKFQDIKTGKTLGEGVTRNGLYVLEEPSPSNSISFLPSTCVAVSSDALWHARLGHPHTRALELMLPNLSFDHASCEACILGKHCKTVFPKSSTIYENCFDLVHSDVWTSPCISRDYNKYFVTFIDEKSKYTWITLLPSKDRVFDAFKNFQNYITNQFNAKLKVLRTDNGGEYISQRFKDHLAKHGILHQTSCPYTPQQNGVAERKNRHLMEVARSMMFHTNVPRRFWGDAVLAACYLINRIPTKVLEDLSPFEVLNKTKPSFDHLKVFGCVCFVLIPGEQRNKLDAKSTKGIFIGYSTTQKGYKCFDPLRNRIMISRDVKFLEEQGYYDKKDWNDVKDLADFGTDRATNLRFILDHLGASGSQTRPQPVEPQNEVQVPGPQTDISRDNHICTGQSSASTECISQTHAELPTHNSQPLDEQHMNDSVEPDVDDSEDDHQELTQIEPAPLRRSTRIRKDPSNWTNTRVFYNNQAVAHPIQAVCSLALLPFDHQAFLGKIELEQVPTTYEEAKEKKVWRDAIGDEVQAMERNHTWDEADLPQGKKAVSSKWVFTIKYQSNGDIERYKARLVARGFTQTYGEDFTDTFAPVAKLHTVRVVLSLATNLSWELWQMDVKNAFLQGELEEEVYMHPPPGLEDIIQPGKVFRLRKAIYGLKQSPRAWYHKLSSTLKSRGFHMSQSDHTLFTLQSTTGIVVILIYVDDLIISGDDKDGIASTKTYLKSVFDIKDLGELKYFLGIEVCRSSDGLFISQRKYTLDLLSETGKLGAKPAKTPLEDGYKVIRKGEKDDTPFEDISCYRRLVGKLIYLTLTRPDLCFAVNQVSQHMQTPTNYHYSMLERILRYLKGSPGQGIWMGKNDNTAIVGYCDADWAGDRIDRKSTTGYCTFVGGNLVTWKTKKQKIVSCSSAEAEYRAMRKLTDELTWLKALLKDLGIESSSPITMHCDNQAAIHIASNSVFHERTKHIEVDCHKVRERIEEGIMLPCYTRSEDQLADIFTKAASLKVCNHIYSKLGLVDISRP